MPEPTEPTHRQFTVYHNGNIYTMEGEEATKVECLAVGMPGFGGKIEYAGTLDGLPEHIKTKGLMYDLKESTLMPGFIDPHCHPSMAGILLNTHFITPLEWKLPRQDVPATQTPEDYLSELTAFIKREIKKDGEEN